MNLISRNPRARLFFLPIMFLSIYLIIQDGCSCTPSSQTEVCRLLSADGLVEAVLTTAGVGATTSTVYRVFVVPAGQSVELGRELLRADKVNNMRINWYRPKLLAIQYDYARIFQFKNFVSVIGAGHRFPAGRPLLPFQSSL